MGETRHLSVWLAAEDAVLARASTLIAELARAQGTPAFTPHVTVLGGVEDGPDRPASLRRTAEETPPFTVRVTHLEHQQVYHRALYAVAEAPELYALHERAAAAFGVAPDTSYRPHLSLLYGDLPAEVKEHILEERGRRFDLDFRVRRLELWVTGGRPEAWTRLEGRNLGAS